MKVCRTILKNKRINNKDELIEKYKNLNEDFEQNYYSRTATGLYKIGHDSRRLMKWMAYYDKYGTRNSFDVIASVLSCLSKISER